MKSGFLERLFLVGIIFVFVYHLSSGQVSSPAPDPICSDADVFCDSASMFGPWTLPPDIIPQPINKRVCTGTTNSGSFNNQLFFPFVPSSPNIIIDILILSMGPNLEPYGGAVGYQWGIVDGCDFNTNNLIDCDGSQIKDSQTTIQVSNLKPGHTYYLYIDGYEGSEVTFNLKVRKGIGNLVVDEVKYFNVEGLGGFFAGDTVSVCHNGEFKIEVEGVTNAPSFVWQVNGIKENSDSSLLYRFKNRNTVYKVEAQGYTDCASSPFGALYFKVDTIADEIFKDTVVCAADLSAGIFPSGWLNPIAINKEGISIFKVVLSNGCYYWQQIRVSKQIEPIVSVDTVLCNVTEIFFGGNKITRDTVVQMKYQTTIGCDSIVNYMFYFIKFDGTVSQLECYNGSSYMLKVNAPDFNPGDYDSLKVDWLLNNVYYKETKTLEFYPVSVKGIYSAIVTLYKNNRSCSFNLNSVNITQIPDASFVLNKDIICETDSIILRLNNYMNNVVYKVSSQNINVQDIGNGNYQLEWVTPGVYSVKVESDFNGCKSEYGSQVTVKKELNQPVLSCTKTTNTSVEFDWIESDSDCLDEYEIWINGVFQKKVLTGPSNIAGLTYGEAVNITVKALSDCVCPGKKDSIVCKALPCPVRNIKIKGLPLEICADELETSYTLNYESDTPGITEWSGEGVESGGKILSSKLKIGKNLIFLKLTIGECVYNIDTSITVLPEVKFDFNVTDISCYDTEDGSVTINTTQGTPDFRFLLNGKSYPSNFIGGLKNGKYDLEVIDSKGCNAKASFTLIQPDKPDFNIIGEDKVNFNQTYTYLVESEIDNIDSIIWFQDDSLICADRFCDSININAVNDFSLCVELIYGNGCTVSDCKDVRVIKDFNIKVPNVFTPNFDGVNDYFKIKSQKGVNVYVKTLRIFDRWGEMLFRKDNFTFIGEFIGWDGRHGDKLASPGVYVYFIEVIDDKGEIIRLAGDVTLLR